MVTAERVKIYLPDHTIGSILSPCRSLKDEVRLLFVGLNMPPLIVTMGFFDESGKLKDSEITVFAGVLLRTESTLYQEWHAALQKFGIPFVSMKELMHMEGPFCDWHNSQDGEQRRELLVQELTRIVMEPGVMRVSCRIASKDFNSLPERTRKLLGRDPHYASFEACIRSCLEACLDIQLHITCDLYDQYSESCVKLFHKVRMLRPDIKARTSGICFSDDEVCLGLQAADLVAYCARADAGRNAKTPHPVIEQAISTFATQDRKSISQSPDLGVFVQGTLCDDQERE
jgi:hypothetical protein